MRAAMVERLRDRGVEVADRTVERIWAEIPAYSGLDYPGLQDDVRQHIVKHHEKLVGLLAAETAPTHEDMLFTRRHTAARVGRVPIADYMKAFRTYQEVIWDVLLQEAADEGRRQAVLTVVGPVLAYVNMATTYAAELYIEIEQLELAGGERVRRDLLEDLVAGRPVVPGPGQDAAREAGLGPESACLVVVAVPRGNGGGSPGVGPPGDEQTLRSASGALARATRSRLTPLTVLRRDEIVVIAAARDVPTSGVVAGLSESYERLAKQQLRLAIGVSTVQPGLGGVASAYREARGAAECLGPEGGVLALPALSAFDYLISFRDATAQRLIAPAIQRFVEEDLEHGGVLTSTLLAYVDSNLNVKAMSKRLHVHSNTAHYRLHRIAEQTGLDLRKLDDVLGLVVAIRLARPRGERPPGAWG